MKIAFFTEGYDPWTNGVVVLIKAYRAALCAAGHEVVIFAPEHPGRPAEEDQVVRLPSMTYDRRTYACLRPFSGIETVFRSGEFDVIHSHHPLTCGAAGERLSKRYNVPLVYTFHTMLTNFSGYFAGPKFIAEKSLLHIMRRHCQRAHCVTVTTRIMESWLRENKVQTPIMLVRPPFEGQNIQPGDRERFRAKWGVKPETTVLLCAGRLSLEKGVDFLIESAKQLPRSLDWKVVVAGDGPLREELETLAKDLGIGNRVLFNGLVPHGEMAAAYAAADVLTFPSANDTLGLVLLEAMSAGLPTVAVACNGPLEAVKHGETGLLTPVETKPFADAMIKLIMNADLRHEMGQAGKRWVREFCSQDTAGALLQAYETAARRQRFVLALAEERKRPQPLVKLGKGVRRVRRTRSSSKPRLF